MCGRGACMAGGMCGKGVVPGREVCVVGACMVGYVCGRWDVHGGGMHGKGVCMEDIMRYGQ